MDKRAVSILFDTYWSKTGWRPEREQKTSPENLAYAKAQGTMFDPLPLDHSAVLSRLINLAARLTPRAVGDAFLASLSTRRLDWRSSLGSYAVFRHVQVHEPAGKDRCSICGLYLRGTENLNVLNFERMKWGGVRHDYPAYAMLDLQLLLKDPPAKPSDKDVVLFESLIRKIKMAPENTTSGNLHKDFPADLKGNKAERDTVVGILGYVGALATKDHPGYSKRFVPADSRPLPNRHFVDMQYPACWWRRDEGFDLGCLRPYFGHASDVL